MSNTEGKNEELRLIRLPEVLARTGLSRPSIYRSMAAGGFPKPARFGRATFWAAHEVDEWIRDRLAKRTGVAA
jgi:prophage regulatory protein